VSVRPKPSLRACGARPSRGGQSKLGWPSGENPGITRRAVFSEGRTPCVRKYGPDASPDISFPPHASKMTRGPCRDMSRLGPSHPCGRAEPAPPRGGKPSTDGLTEEGPETTRETVFSKGGALRVRVGRPYASPGISFPPHASKMTRGPCGDMYRLGPSHPCGRAEPAPPGGASPAQMALRRKARRRRERRFSRRDALRASALQGRRKPGRNMITEAPTNARRPSRDMSRLGPSHPCGRAEPAPPGVDSPSSDGLAGEGPRCQGGFPGGTRSARPQIRAVHRPRHLILNPSVNDGPIA
jgi:hypothetical protein